MKEDFLQNTPPNPILIGAPKSGESSGSSRKRKNHPHNHLHSSTRAVDSAARVNISGGRKIPGKDLLHIHYNKEKPSTCSSEEEEEKEHVNIINGEELLKNMQNLLRTCNRVAAQPFSADNPCAHLFTLSTADLSRQERLAKGEREESASSSANGPAEEAGPVMDSHAVNRSKETVSIIPMQESTSESGTAAERPIEMKKPSNTQQATLELPTVNPLGPELSAMYGDLSRSCDALDDEGDVMVWPAFALVESPIRAVLRDHPALFDKLKNKKQQQHQQKSQQQQPQVAGWAKTEKTKSTTFKEISSAEEGARPARSSVEEREEEKKEDLLGTQKNDEEEIFPCKKDGPPTRSINNVHNNHKMAKAEPVVNNKSKGMNILESKEEPLMAPAPEPVVSEHAAGKETPSTSSKLGEERTRYYYSAEEPSSTSCKAGPERDPRERESLPLTGGPIPEETGGAASTARKKEAGCSGVIMFETNGRRNTHQEICVGFSVDNNIPETEEVVEETQQSHGEPDRLFVDSNRPDGLSKKGTENEEEGKCKDININKGCCTTTGEEKLCTGGVEKERIIYSVSGAGPLRFQEGDEAVQEAAGTVSGSSSRKKEEDGCLSNYPREKNGHSVVDRVFEKLKLVMINEETPTSSPSENSSLVDVFQRLYSSGATPRMNPTIDHCDDVLASLRARVIANIANIADVEHQGCRGGDPISALKNSVLEFSKDSVETVGPTLDKSGGPLSTPPGVVHKKGSGAPPAKKRSFERSVSSKEGEDMRMARAEKDGKKNEGPRTGARKKKQGKGGPGPFSNKNKKSQNKKPGIFTTSSSSVQKTFSADNWISCTSSCGPRYVWAQGAPAEAGPAESHRGQSAVNHRPGDSSCYVNNHSRWTTSDSTNSSNLPMMYQIHPPPPGHFIWDRWDPAGVPYGVPPHSFQVPLPY